MVGEGEGEGGGGGCRRYVANFVFCNGWSCSWSGTWRGA